MLLTHKKYSATIMNQSQEIGLSQGAYLERLLLEQHQQYQQKFQQQLLSDSDVNDDFSNNSGVNFNSNEKICVTRPPVSSMFSPGNSITKSPGVALSNSMGIGMSHHQQQQQNRMISFLQERQQQQFIAANIVSDPLDLSSNLGIASLSSSVGLDSRAGGSGVGSCISSNSWIDGCSSNVIGTGAIGNVNSTLYPTEQNILLSSQRYTGGNRLPVDVEANGSFIDSPLTSIIGGLPQYCFSQQSLTSAQISLNTHQKPNRKSFTDMLLAKQAQAALLQAAQAHLPRTIRLPCGARGMKADHNSSTAYFDVPENARHGQHLLCSHSVCRAAGVKFRYCFYCKKPVTKQNFRSRHLHADLDPNNKKKDKNEVEWNSRNSKEKMTQKHKIVGMRQKNSNDKPLVEMKFRKLVNDDKNELIESLATQHIGCTDDGSERPSKVQKLSHVDGEKGFLRRSQWGELLQESPPDDLDAIDSWVSKVLSVSNPEIYSSSLRSIDIVELKQRQQRQFNPENLTSEALLGLWDSLFDRRPETNKSKYIKDWLVKALELSIKYHKIKK